MNGEIASRTSSGWGVFPAIASGIWFFQIECKGASGLIRRACARCATPGTFPGRKSAEREPLKILRPPLPPATNAQRVPTLLPPSDGDRCDKVAQGPADALSSRRKTRRVAHHHTASSLSERTE